MQLSGDPSGLPEGRPGLDVCHSFCRGTLKCFLGCLTKYSNEPLAFSLHKAQLKVIFRILRDNSYAAGPSPAAESKHKKSINECRGNTEVQHALIKIQLRVYS